MMLVVICDVCCSMVLFCFEKCLFTDLGGRRQREGAIMPPVNKPHNRPFNGLKGHNNENPGEITFLTKVILFNFYGLALICRQTLCSPRFISAQTQKDPFDTSLISRSQPNCSSMNATLKERLLLSHNF